MLGGQEYFKNGRIDKAALVAFIKDIKKNTNLSDEDAAVIAASKVTTLQLLTPCTQNCRWWTASPRAGCGTGSMPPGP